MKHKKNKLEFTPFTHHEADVLISNIPKYNQDIISYKVNNWFDSSHRILLYGIACKSKEGTWYNMCDGERAVIFNDRKLADKVCLELKKILLNNALQTPNARIGNN